MKNKMIITSLYKSIKYSYNFLLYNLTLFITVNFGKKINKEEKQILFIYINRRYLYINQINLLKL